MLQSRQAISGLVRRLAAGHGDAPFAFTLGLRNLSGSSTTQHVQPAPLDDHSSASDGETPRWQRELGSIRTDWT